jgi:hypothetical protein
MNEYFPPQWIESNKENFKKKLREDSFENYVKFSEHYNILNIRLISDLPPSITNVYQKKKEPSFFLIESSFFHFMYTYLYKLRYLCQSLNFTFEEGNFVSSVVLARSMFETICCYCYFLRRIENKVTSMSNPSNSSEIGRLMYEVMDLLHRSHAGSNFNWQENLKLDFKLKTQKQLHINDPIRELEKKSKKPVKKYYSLLSEMTHPNFGSNTLIIQTRGGESEVAYELILGNTKHSECLMWFFDNLSEVMYEMTNFALTSMDKTKDLSILFKNLTSIYENSNKSVH